MRKVATFSIAGFDPNADEWGIAVASKFLAVGAVVPWARAKVGAVATQAFANLTFGPRGLDLLADGRSAKEVVDELVSSDLGSEHRQVGVVDFEGESATFTGEECLEWAGGTAGEGFAAQGNILTGPEVIEEMVRAFTSVSGALADRLLAALSAGDRAGGDRRGRQSAALLVVREAGGYGGANDRAIDLRVDDHSGPVQELIRLRSIHRLYLERPKEEDILEIDDALGTEIYALLVSLGAHEGGSGAFDAAAAEALRVFMGIENLEERWVEGRRIDQNVLDYLRAKSVALGGRDL